MALSRKQKEKKGHLKTKYEVSRENCNTLWWFTWERALPDMLSYINPLILLWSESSKPNQYFLKHPTRFNQIYNHQLYLSVQQMLYLASWNSSRSSIELKHIFEETITRNNNQCLESILSNLMLYMQRNWIRELPDHHSPNVYEIKS